MMSAIEKKERIYKYTCIAQKKTILENKVQNYKPTDALLSA